MVQTAENKKKIGLLGGTFDPVHNGHLAVANHVQLALKLDSILFIPAALPPHKPGHDDGREISSFIHRLTMLERAIINYSSFAVSDIEGKRSSPSYSIDTINILISQTKDQADLFFIIGVDAFVEIETWKRYKDLPNLVNFVVISRTTHSFDEAGEIIRKNFSGYAYDASQKIWRSPTSNGCFILQHMEAVEISSTGIREKIRTGKNITGLIPSAVEEYIKNQELYI
jgi:nicotinate-nucleotide adenylyltransferase